MLLSASCRPLGMTSPLPDQTVAPKRPLEMSHMKQEENGLALWVPALVFCRISRSMAKQC